MRLDERERPGCVKEVELSNSSPFMRTGGKFCLRLLEVAGKLSSYFGRTKLGRLDPICQ